MELAEVEQNIKHFFGAATVELAIVEIGQRKAGQSRSWPKQVAPGRWPSFGCSTLLTHGKMCVVFSHTVRQGEGGEQGDALMPLLFALGQHRALVAIQSELQDGEFLFACWDDINAWCFLTVGAVCASVQQHLWAHCRIRVHTGKTQVWNSEGLRPTIGDVLERIAVAACGEDQATRISPQQGMKVLGTPLGHLSFVEAHEQKLTE